MKKILLMVIITAVFSTLVGCGEQKKDPRQDCIDRQKETDPTKRAALDEKCGFGGGGFKKSEEKSW